MKKLIQMFLRQWTRSPVKTSLTILALALGTGILILSFSVSALLKQEVSDKLEKDGAVLFLANGSWQNDGTWELAGPPDWDSDIIQNLISDTGMIETAAIVSSMPLDEVTVNGSVYRLRNTLGTSKEYFTIFDLSMLAGLAMDDNDIAQGSRKVWLSEDLANELFGSAQEALGQWIQPPGMMFQRGPRRSRNLIIQYQVAGVYASPNELARKAYGIADLIFPWTSMLSSEGNQQFEKNRMSQLIVLKTKNISLGRASAYLKSAIANTYGDDVESIVWEGSAKGSSSYLENLRGTVSLFTISLNVLGIVLLVISALGVFSIMVVESLGRRREIALERALGASQFLVLREFWLWSMALSLLGALIGTLLAFALAPSMVNLITPLAGEISQSFSAASGLNGLAVGAGILLAVLSGGILGVLPAIPSVQGCIADTLREV